MENYRIFDSELVKLSNNVIKMARQVNEQLVDVTSALKNVDLPLARKVINNDVIINNLDVKIDKLCQKIFALQQPVASDLRYIISALKINNDLERIGDHAVNIAKRIDPLVDYASLIEELYINEIAGQTLELFDMVVKTVETHSIEYVNAIYEKGAQIKANCEKASARILGEMMHQSEVVVVAANILILCNLFERVAGYSTNIAESISFVVEGEIVKHRNSNS